MPTCQTCRYFRPCSPQKGECRRHAPQPRVDLQLLDTDHLEYWPDFPLVDGLGCGDHRPPPLGQKDGAERELERLRVELAALRAAQGVTAC